MVYSSHRPKHVRFDIPDGDYGSKNISINQNDDDVSLRVIEFGMSIDSGLSWSNRSDSSDQAQIFKGDSKKFGTTTAFLNPVHRSYLTISKTPHRFNRYSKPLLRGSRHRVRQNDHSKVSFFPSLSSPKAGSQYE